MRKPTDINAARRKRGDILVKLQSEYSLLLMNNETLAVRRKRDDTFNRTKWQFLKIRALKDFYAAYPIILVTGRGRELEINPVDIWRKDPATVRYEGIIFSPECDIEGYLNLWQGFAFEPKKGACQRYLDHLLYNICNGNKEYFEYLLDWMANAIQHPWKRPGVAIVLRGGRGVGKGVALGWFGKLFGNHFLQISNCRHLVGNFNSHLMDVIFLFIDEAFWAGDKTGESVLKSLVTEDRLVIEQKGRDVIDLKNYLRIAIASNAEWVVPSGIDERRWFVLDVAEHKKQNHAYFAAIEEEMKNGGLEALMFMLMTRKYSEMKLRKVPQTSALLEQKFISMPSHERFVMNLLWQGYNCRSELWINEVDIKELQEMYMDYAKNAGEIRRKDEVGVGKAVRKFLGVPVVKRSSEGISRRRCYEFTGLSLTEARERAQKKLGQAVDWPKL